MAVWTSYDVRYDVPRPARLSSSISRRHGAARITATGVVGPPAAATVGSDVGIICLTAAAAAARAKAKRWHSQGLAAAPAGEVGVVGWGVLSHMLGVFGGPQLELAVPAAMWKRLTADVGTGGTGGRTAPRSLAAGHRHCQWGSHEQQWLASWLAAARQQLDAFTAEGLVHSLWALAALGYVPDKLWLRAACGMVAYKIKSFLAKELSLLLPALSSLGYKPRPEVCRTVIAQVRRNLHTLKPSQLASVFIAISSFPPEVGLPAGSTGWHPGRLFLFDYVSHTQPPAVMGAWSGQQAAQVLWGFSRCRYVPDSVYLKLLLSHLESQLAACDADSLSMALWALAVLQQQPPSQAWAKAWCAAAEATGDTWGPQALAHGVSAMAALQIRPPASLMQVLTRTASSCLASFSCMELGLLIAGLADLHWRPSELWMRAFVSQVSQQLPAFENEDYGLLLFGLACLAQPLHPQLLGRFCAEAKRKLYGLSGEGLGLLVWGMAQYDYDMEDAQDWWAAVFAEYTDKWTSTKLRGCALAVVGLAQAGPRYLPPGDWEAAFITRYKSLNPHKPHSWPELLLGLRAAAGLEPAEQLPTSVWLNNLLLQLGKAWNLEEPEQGVARLISAVNNDVLAAAAALSASANGIAAGLPGQHSQDTVQVLPGSAVQPVPLVNSDGIVEQSDAVAMEAGKHAVADIQPTSATAVLL
eukprot:gene12740-12869_t